MSRFLQLPEVIGFADQYALFAFTHTINFRLLHVINVCLPDILPVSKSKLDGIFAFIESGGQIVAESVPEAINTSIKGLTNVEKQSL